MTVFPALPSLLRRALPWLAGLAALGALGFATAAALMFFWVLPNISEHRDTVANLLSRALGQRVTLEAVSGVWQQARPEFRLRGVRLHDHEGRLALHLPELEAAFAWRSFLLLEPRFSSIELKGLVLDVRRARDGHFYVGGIPVNPASPDSRFSNWLLRQGWVHVGDAKLVWHDEVRNAPVLQLEAVDLTLANQLRRHRLQLRATPPASLARPLILDAQLTARDIEDLSTWNGTVETRVAGVSFPQLATWLRVPFQPHAGWGSLRVRLDVTQGALSGVGAGVDLRAIETTLGAGLPPVRITQARGQVLWARGADGQRIAFENLRIALPGGSLGAPFNAGVSWNASAREISATALRLNEWQSLLPSLPMDAALRSRLQTLQPQGRFDTLLFRWTGAVPGVDNFSIAARFRGLGVTAIESQPGLANLSGSIEGDAREGRFEIDSPQLTIDLPALFREPRMRFDSMKLRGTWLKTPHGRLVTLDAANFANRDAQGTATGRYEWIPGHRGVIDLSARLTRADGTAVYRYLPKRIGDQTVDWVKRAVLAGRGDDVQLRLRGDLQHFPFDQGNGEFRVDAQLSDGVIDYVAGWPRIEGIRARMLFEGKSMTVTATQARIYGVDLLPVKAVIPDLLHHEELLQVEGEARGPAQDFIRFANFSPVGERLRGFTDALSGSGPMQLALELQLPLRHLHDTSVNGKLSFLGNTFFPSGLPRIDQIRGEVDFTHDTLAMKNLTAQLLGGPMRLDTANLNGKVQILAQGRATAQGLAPWLGKAWDRRLSGQTGWRGQIDFEPDGERVRIESDLAGLGSTLPAPLAKSASQPLPMLITSQPQGDGWLREMRFGRTVSAVWRSGADGAFARGEIRFGGQAVLPGEPGMRLAGSGRGLDISGWVAMMPGGDAADGPGLSSIDLSFDALDLMGRRYQDVRLQGRTRNGLLRTQVTGRDLNGVLTYRPEGEQPARISAQFRLLTVPGRAPFVSGTAEPISMRAADFPMLDVTVEDFRLQERPLGRLQAVAHGSPQGMVIESLQLTHPDSVFRMSGLWRDSAQTETRADLSLSVLDAGKFLTRFGYPDALRRGSVEIAGNATWVGTPADFAFDTLAGQLDFKAKGGQFLKVDPGAAKLLGVLSLQSLPRRLNFDFRDIFNEGYAFDDISATLRIARGVVYSDDFKMRGPAAKVNMSGLADLNQDSVQLRVKVIPKLSEGVAVAGALIGGPLAGVGALAAQKLLRDPFEEATSQEYMVTGSWQAPDVKRLPKARPKGEPQQSEP